MRDDAPSRTAQWVAAARGMGRLLPEAVRLADDPYGLAFASQSIARLVDRTRDNRPDRAAAIARVPGLSLWIVYMQVRTRLIDDAVRGFVAGGGRQVVVLGAGYDCRALRMPELADARVIEVDHPATQRHKREVLDRLADGAGRTAGPVGSVTRGGAGRTAGPVRSVTRGGAGRTAGPVGSVTRGGAGRTAASPAEYLAWDFETHPMDDLPGALADAGLDPAAPSLTIWEGVTMYLTEAAIDASLRAVATWSAAGSQLAMTYMTRSRLQRSLAVRAVRAVVSRLGEPFRFGWEPDELPDYLAARGFALVSDVATFDAGRAMLPPDLALQIVQTDRVVIAKRR